MVHFTDISVLKNFARQRQDLGTERWLPIRGVSENGIISLLPGNVHHWTNSNSCKLDGQFNVCYVHKTSSLKKTVKNIHRLSTWPHFDYF